MTMGGWTQGPQGRPEGKGLDRHKKRKRSKWEPDYDAADWRMIATVVLIGCVVACAVGACIAIVEWAIR